MVFAYVKSNQNVRYTFGLPEDSTSLMAEDLNGYFSSVVTTEDISSLPVPDDKLHDTKLNYLGQLIETPEMVGKKIKAMKDNKSPGLEGIPPRQLMETVQQIRIPVARVFNLSIKERVVQCEWKKKNIMPLFIFNIPEISITITVQ